MVTDLPLNYQVDSFTARLTARAHEKRTWLCVGIDPDLAALPATLDRDADGVTRFCTAIIDATHDLVAAFKINVAFFEALGVTGWSALARVRDAIPPDVPVVFDAKRGDVGNTARAYAHAFFGELRADSMTVSPYLGADSLQPFMDYPGKHIFMLCKTSNPGASDLQDLAVDGEPLYLRVARLGLALEGKTEVGFVVGATQPGALVAVRALDAHALLLLPGVGAQGGDAADALRLGSDVTGDLALLSASREVLFASSDRDFVDAAHAAAARMATQCWLDPIARAAR